MLSCLTACASQAKQKKILPGDYQVQVHIIEVRDLYSGRSEDPKPVVLVECAKTKKMTAAGASSRSQVLDEVLFIEMQKLDKACALSLKRIGAHDRLRGVWRCCDMVDAVALCP